eukprot:jgi/Tetstr1/464688/TSEL_009439.t1
MLSAFVEDIPQICLQVAFVVLEGGSLITFISLSFSSVSVVVRVIYRLLLILRPSDAGGDVAAVPEHQPETAITGKQAPYGAFTRLSSNFSRSVSKQDIERPVAAPDTIPAVEPGLEEELNAAHSVANTHHSEALLHNLPGAAQRASQLPSLHVQPRPMLPLEGNSNRPEKMYSA